MGKRIDDLIAKNVSKDPLIFIFSSVEVQNDDSTCKARYDYHEHKPELDKLRSSNHLNHHANKDGIFFESSQVVKELGNKQENDERSHHVL